MSLKLKICALCLSPLFISSLAHSHEKGDTIIRLGAAMVSPQDSSSVLYANGIPLPGTSVTVDDNTQLGIALTHMISNHFGIELLAATPFTHTATAKGLGAPLDVADVKHLPPTLSLHYYPLNPNSKFQFYVGAGLNYTTFFSEELTSEFEAAIGSGDIELDGSLGLAVQIGADYQLTDLISLSASIWQVDIETTATIDLDSGNTIKADIDIDPMVYMVGLGFRF